MGRCDDPKGIVQNQHPGSLSYIGGVSASGVIHQSQDDGEVDQKLLRPGVIDQGLLPGAVLAVSLHRVHFVRF